MGANAQSLIDKDIERIAFGALAEEISYCPEDTIRYLGIIVIEAATGNVVTSLFYKDGEFIKNPHRNTYDVVKNVMDTLVLSRLSKSSDSLSTESKSIKHRDEWIHPAAR